MCLFRGCHQTTTWLLAALAVTAWAYRVDAQDSASLNAAPFVRLAETVTQDNASSVGTYEYAGTQMRQVLASPSTSRPLLYPVDQEGYIHIQPGQELPALEPGSEGLRLMLQYYGGSLSLFSNTRKGFAFLSRDELEKDETIALRPPGKPTAYARLYARQALPQKQRILTGKVTVPAEGRLDFAIALQQDWRIPDGAGATFCIHVIREQTSELLYEETFVLPKHFEGTFWRERTVGVGGYAGQGVRFLFETRPASIATDPDARFAFPLWGNPLLHTKVPTGCPDIPNIVLIALDTLRADRLGCYGYTRPTSPNIDRFAANNILFEKAFSPASWTTPTFASLFTGLPPSRHQAGLFRKGFVLNDQFTSLAERLGQTGRLTAAWTEGISIRAQLGFYQGFTVYSDGETPDRHETGGAQWTFQRAAAWLDKFGHLPFFLFVHTYECHEPYAPPSPWDSMFTDPDYSGKAGSIAASAVNEADKFHVSGRYDGCIAYADKWTGWFLEHLKALGLMNNTLVILFSDHGEEFWEHGGYGHGLTLFDEVLHVPLILHLPTDAVKPQRIGAQVSLVDVFATLLDLTGVPLPEGTDSESLMPLIAPGNAATYARPHVISELYTSEAKYKDDYGLPFEWLSRSLRTPGYKYIVSNKPDIQEEEAQPVYPDKPTESLYNLTDDPLEQHNLAGKQIEQLSRLKQDLLEFLRASDPLQDVSGIKPVQVDDLKEDDIQSLQALGYL